MKFTLSLIAVLYLATSVASASLPVKRDTVTPDLIPSVGNNNKGNPDNAGNCDSATIKDGKPVLIPCSCPPPDDIVQAALKANVAAGHMVNNTKIAAPFPSGQDNPSKAARIQTLISTIQNFNGTGGGVGCPAISTDLNAQLALVLPPAAPPA